MDKRKYLKGLGYVVGGVCLLGVGFYLGFREGLVAGGASASVVELQASEGGMVLQLKEGTCESAKKAINAYLDFLDKYKGKNELIFPARTYHADKMLGHMRLFLIERHQKNAKEANNQLKAAIFACQQGEIRDCSEKNVMVMAEKWNQSQPMGCLASQK
ncbi:MAG TPA: hypothetical protein V6D26_23570 [Stenomitos sp.]